VADIGVDGARPAVRDDNALVWGMATDVVAATVEAGSSHAGKRRGEE
jgi:hypothetical protein